MQYYQKYLKQQQTNHRSITYADYFIDAEQSLQSKINIKKQLKKKIQQTKKWIFEQTKLLQDGHLKNKHEKLVQKLNQEVNLLHSRKRYFEKLQSISTQNMRKFEEHITTMQNQLQQNQYPKKGIQKINSKKQDKLKRDQTNQYNQLCIHIEMYRKMKKDYHWKVQKAQSQKQEIQLMNKQLMNKIIDIENGIQKIEKQIQNAKEQIDPEKLKPIFKKYNIVIQDNSSTLKHLCKAFSIGKVSHGRTFIDRYYIGKQKAKIVHITFFQSKDAPNNIIGLQATYLVNHIYKKANANIISSVKKVNTKFKALSEGDYFTSLDCFLNSEEIVIGVTLSSHMNQIVQGGCIMGRRKKIVPTNCYPICLFGSILGKGLEMLGTQIDERQQFM